MSDSPIIVALDFPEASQALDLATRLDPGRCRLKVGSELYTAAGPTLIETLQNRGFQIFLDLKFHDIPNTVAGACRVAGDLGVWMVNVHAQGGRRMMMAARDALGAFSSPPLLLAVTVLTSLDVEDLKELGLEVSPAELVSRLASLAMTAGLDGVVCSPREVAMLRQQLGPDPCLVTPGIRPPGATGDDQRRTLAPRQALDLGASFLVVGRPVTGAADPARALAELLQTG